MTIAAISQEGTKAMTKAYMHDRVIGTLYGSALGDAIGLYTEFLSAELSRQAYPSGSFTLLPASAATPFRRDNHRVPHDPGEWTDDTDHAMLILLSYLHHDGKVLNPQDFAERLHSWVHHGLRALNTLPLGLGRTVGAIVKSENYLKDPEGTSRKHWADLKYKPAPNGSLMRTHPLGLMCLDKTVPETLQLAADFSATTHVDPRCLISCAIGTALIRGLVRGDITEEEHINLVIEQACQWWTSYRKQYMKDESRQVEPDLDLQELLHHTSIADLNDLHLDESYKIGYVYKCLGSGIHLLRLAMRRIARGPTPLQLQVTAFEPLITGLIMQGGDADTNACFAGALLGAYLGYTALPSHWRDGLKYGEWLMVKAEALSTVIGVREGRYSGADDKDTAPDGGRGVFTEKELEEKWAGLKRRFDEHHQTNRKREEAEKKKQAGWFAWK
ncbi:adp-ribosylglycohydrolase [Paramyrothecium foliicola]|nr:adp-ribosylglycohydrolase [Paramyrothecium foliicola]